jgi:hypothetical protein
VIGCRACTPTWSGWWSARSRSRRRTSGFRKACARVSGIADPFNGHIDAFRIAYVQRSGGWIETTWNNMCDPGAFAAAGAEEQEGSEPATAGRQRGRRQPDGMS